MNDNTLSNERTQNLPSRSRLPRLAIVLARNVIIVGLPFLLVLLNARALMTPPFLALQYASPWVPDDQYGMDESDREEYAQLALAYLFNDAGIQFLGDQAFPDGTPLYNDRELSHMFDVKEVTKELTTFGLGLLAAVVVAVGLLAADAPARKHLFSALFQGGVVTIALIVGGLILTATSFNWLFTQFHGLFFEGDSWLFLYTDTLIRLFPIEFWTAAFAGVFGLALLEAGLIVFFSRRWLRRNRPA